MGRSAIGARMTTTFCPISSLRTWRTIRWATYESIHAVEGGPPAPVERILRNVPATIRRCKRLCNDSVRHCK